MQGPIACSPQLFWEEMSGMNKLSSGSTILPNGNTKSLLCRCNCGFSLVELTIVVMMACILISLSLLNIHEILPGWRANEAMNQAVAQFRRGREVAIAQRRHIELRFVDKREIQLLLIEEPAHTRTVLNTATLNTPCEFIKFGSIENDTPDSFGNSGSIDFGGAGTLVFSTEGMLTDQSGDPINGTVFLGIPEHPETARAITVLGATGRIKSYRWTKNGWTP